MKQLLGASITTEQERLVGVTAKKWQALIGSTEKVELSKAKAAMDVVHATLSLEKPEVVICSSPVECLNRIVLGESLQGKLNAIVAHIQKSLQAKLPSKMSMSATVLMPPDIFCHIKNLLELPPSPVSILANSLRQQVEEQIGSELLCHLEENLKVLSSKTSAQLENHLVQLFKNRLMNQIHYELDYRIESFLKETMGTEYAKETKRKISGFLWQELAKQKVEGLGCLITDYGAAVIDYAVTVLGCQVEKKQWQAMRLVLRNCGTVYGGEVCIVCDRPEILNLSRGNCLHSIASPALQYRDGHSIYSYQGTIIPKKYGALPLEKWDTQWLLKEGNLDLKSVITHGIGYARTQEQLRRSTNSSASSSDGEPQNIPQEQKLTSISLNQAIKISSYVQKWQEIAFSPQSPENIDPVIAAAYISLGKKVPQILSYSEVNKLNFAPLVEEQIKGLVNHIKNNLDIFNNPNTVEKDLGLWINKITANILSASLINELQTYIENRVDSQLDIKLKTQLLSQIKIKDFETVTEIKSALLDRFLEGILLRIKEQVLCNLGDLDSKLLHKMNKQIGKLLVHSFRKEIIRRLKNHYRFIALADFCSFELRCPLPRQTWKSLHLILRSRAWLYNTPQECYIMRYELVPEYHFEYTEVQ